jgi:hypothetical protein
MEICKAKREEGGIQIFSTSGKWLDTNIQRAGNVRPFYEK